MTYAIKLYQKLRREFPEESPRQIWSRVDPVAIPEYTNMTAIEQRTAREELRERVGWRRRKRRHRKIPIDISVS